MNLKSHEARTRHTRVRILSVAVVAAGTSMYFYYKQVIDFLTRISNFSIEFLTCTYRLLQESEEKQKSRERALEQNLMIHEVANRAYRTRTNKHQPRDSNTLQGSSKATRDKGWKLPFLTTSLSGISASRCTNTHTCLFEQKRLAFEYERNESPPDSLVLPFSRVSRL
jgi:hypothetical protein